MKNHLFNALDSRQLQQDIEQLLAGNPLNLLYLDSCESTNLECMKLGDHQSVVIAEQQTAGRGRRGKAWHSPSTQNIYCSIGLQKKLQPELLGLVSLQVGVCIANVLLDLGFDDVSLKWPNDILLQGKKFGGILIETRAVAANEFYLVIGFGLNLHLDQNDITSIDQPAISLSQVIESSIDRHHLLKMLIAQITRVVNEFEQHAIETLLERFSQLDRHLGRRVTIKTRERHFFGLYQGVDPSGQIQIATDEGLLTFSAAEISLRDIDDAAD